MRNFLAGLFAALIVIALLAAWAWRYQPEWWPQELRRENPHSADYAPVVYRWKDDAGNTQLTDQPPTDRPYETVRIDPKRNIVPTTLPPPSHLR